MSNPEIPTEPTPADAVPVIPAQAAPVESTLAYPAGVYAAPATPAYAPPAAPEAPSYPPNPAYQAAPEAQAYPAAYPGYVAPASAVPASGMPASAVPASGVPASGVPYGYSPGYAQPVGAPQYAPAGYPTSSYPAAGMPAPGAPKTPRPKSTLVFGILMVVFLLLAGTTTAMYLGKSSDASKQAKLAASSGRTVTAQKGQIDSLKQQVQAAQDGAAAAKQTSDGQINDLKHTNSLLMTCVTDANTVINLQGVSVSTFNKDFDKMVKSCLVAKAESN